MTNSQENIPYIVKNRHLWLRYSVILFVDEEGAQEIESDPLKYIDEEGAQNLLSRHVGSFGIEATTVITQYAKSLIG